jgi:hypothetical protein
MGSCCRHDLVIYMANIHATGENRALPLTILKRLMVNIDPERPVGIFWWHRLLFGKIYDNGKSWHNSTSIYNYKCLPLLQKILIVYDFRGTSSLKLGIKSSLELLYSMLMLTSGCAKWSTTHAIKQDGDYQMASHWSDSGWVYHLWSVRWGTQQGTTG